MLASAIARAPRTRPPIALIAIAIGLAGCQDPCVTLAERICNCEPTVPDRRACREDRITNQRDKIEIDDQDRDVCEKALDTCDCDAIDNNELEKCGYVNE